MAPHASGSHHILPLSLLFFPPYLFSLTGAQTRMKLFYPVGFSVLAFEIQVAKLDPHCLNRNITGAMCLMLIFLIIT
jgi:hypothetical protein